MELIIVMLHLDYRIMQIVALQLHVMHSMVMDDAVRPSLSVEKVREIVTMTMNVMVISCVVKAMGSLKIIVY